MRTRLLHAAIGTGVYLLIAAAYLTALTSVV